MSMTPKERLLEEAKDTLLELAKFMTRVDWLKDYPDKRLEDQLELDSFEGVRIQLDLWTKALLKDFDGEE